MLHEYRVQANAPPNNTSFINVMYALDSKWTWVMGMGSSLFVIAHVFNIVTITTDL